MILSEIVTLYYNKFCNFLKIDRILWFVCSKVIVLYYQAMIPTSFKHKWELNPDLLFNDKIFYQLSQLEVIIIK